MNAGNADPAPLTRPVPFGDYLLLERIAVGGMAEIFRAVYDGPHGFQKTVVIKRMLPHLAANSAFVDMFIDEARLMGRINHPRIVQVFDFGEVDHQYFIAMEYVAGTDGLTLLQRCAVSRRRPPAHVAVQIVAEVLDALDFAHRLRDDEGNLLMVVHRDVSPSNIFISPRGDVKLGDFGIVHMATRRSETQAGILKGKYGYMAPEQVAGQPVDERRDVFAAGIVLAELLMIRRLFMAENELDVLLQVRDARLERLDRYGKHIPTALRSILNAALARNPDLRYQTAADFSAALMDYLGAEGRVVSNSTVRRFIRKVSPEAEEKSDSGQRHEAVAGAGPLPEQVGVKRPIKLAPPASVNPIASRSTREEQRLGTEDALAAIPELRRDSSSVVTAGTIEVPALDSLPAVPNPEQVASSLLSAEQEPVPDNLRSLGQQSLFCALFKLARAEQTGLVTVAKGDITKQLYLVDGHLEVVLSNQANDLFGQFLLSQEAVAEGELAMALAMLSHFNGRLGDALVGLDLLTPVEVLRHLTLLQRQKVMGLFRWTEGSFAFHPDTRTQGESVPLDVTTFELLGAACRDLPLEFVRQAIGPLLHAPVQCVDPLPLPPEAFQLGPTPRAICSAFQVRQPLSLHLKQLGLPERESLPVVHLLLQTGYLTTRPNREPSSPCNLSGPVDPPA